MSDGARRIYADTNIYIIIFEGKDERRERLAKAFFPPTLPRFTLVASLVTYAELLVGPFKAGDSELVASYESLFGGDTLLEIVPVDQPLLRDAALLRARYRVLRLPDALHIVSAMRAGCSHFVSDETRFPSSFELADSSGTKAARIETLRPDAQGIDKLEWLLIP